MMLSAVLNLAMPIAIAASTAEPNCSRYAAMRRLPVEFEEIASADLVGGAELFILTDGSCTCDNKPAVDRRLGKPAPIGVNWSCRPAAPDERRSEQ
jgi:hypothetical protein